MSKVKAVILIVIISPLIGGFFGIVHDQITFSFSEEYYTKFKFIQFGLENWGLGENIGTLKAPEIRMNHPRLGAAIIGFLATWWVGLFIGIVLALTGLIHKNGKEMLEISSKAIMITITTALLTGLFGLIYGKMFLTENPPNWFLPDKLINQANFIAVGSMHNFSYLGGLIGLITGIVYSVKQKKNKVGIQ